MGRQERAVAAGTRQSEALAWWLRHQRQRLGLTYAEMAFKIHGEVTASALSRAASGRGVPSRRAVEAYAQACEADMAEARRLWKAARWAAQQGPRKPAAPGDVQDRHLADKVEQFVTHPEVLEDFAQMRRAMIQLRAREGQPSLDELQRRAGRAPDGRHHLLPKSSLSSVLHGHSIPLRRHITAFTRALGLGEGKVALWERAWDRIEERTAAQTSPERRRARYRSHPYPAAPVDQPVIFRGFLIDDDDIGTGAAATAAESAVHAAWALAPGLAPSDLTPLRSQGLLPQVFTPTRRHTGPRLALPIAGYTRSGLPIRVPRARPYDRRDRLDKPTLRLRR
ncbi:helix-turn-helix transcriptional regulator [Streptomyces narbonensis]|uniref:Helix-turn-helix transcriptional regulator n=1 Tax=Streptomyces narbonensis TaxID=67333 RepID=A0ABV3CHD9_9ACTN